MLVQWTDQFQHSPAEQDCDADNREMKGQWLDRLGGNRCCGDGVALRLWNQADSFVSGNPFLLVEVGAVALTDSEVDQYDTDHNRADNANRCRQLCQG